MSSRGGLDRVLFLCTGNSARSQIAEALVEHRSAGTVEARSAGSHPKPLHPNAVRVMAERGIDISGRPTKSLTRFARNRFDRVITLCDKVRRSARSSRGADRRALEHRRPRGRRRHRRGDLPRVRARRRRDRGPGGPAARRPRHPTRGKDHHA